MSLRVWRTRSARRGADLQFGQPIGDRRRAAKECAKISSRHLAAAGPGMRHISWYFRPPFSTPEVRSANAYARRPPAGHFQAVAPQAGLPASSSRVCRQRWGSVRKVDDAAWGCSRRGRWVRTPGRDCSARFGLCQNTTWRPRAMVRTSCDRFLPRGRRRLLRTSTRSTTTSAGQSAMPRLMAVQRLGAATRLRWRRPVPRPPAAGSGRQARVFSGLAARAAPPGVRVRAAYGNGEAGTRDEPIVTSKGQVTVPKAVPRAWPAPRPVFRAEGNRPVLALGRIPSPPAGTICGRSIGPSTGSRRPRGLSRCRSALASRGTVSRVLSAAPRARLILRLTCRARHRIRCGTDDLRRGCWRPGRARCIKSL